MAVDRLARRLAARVRYRDGLTITGKDDGFGAQLMAIVSGIAYCRYHGCRYVHTPMNHILPVGTFPSDFDFRLSEANELVDSVVAELGVATVAPNPRQELHMHDAVNRDPDAYYPAEFVRFMARAYPRPRPSLLAGDAIDIAVHVRRGDIEVGDPDRWLDVADYAEVMRRLRADYPGARFHVFSWRDPCAELVAADVTVHCSEDGADFLEVFDCFVYADVLVVGASCLSMCAGLFNPNPIVAPTIGRARTDWASHALPSRWYRY